MKSAPQSPDNGFKQKFLEKQFFRPNWYSVFFNPYFINRYNLYLAIYGFSTAANRKNVMAKILDVGCGNKPYRSLFATPNYTGIDIEGGGHDDRAKTAELYYDGSHIPFSDRSFDVAICTQVLEHASDPEMLVAECSRVLVPGGMLFVSMPFIYPEHEIPFDFRRFTRFQHQIMLERTRFDQIRIKKTTGFFGTFGQLFVIWCFESMKFRASILKGILSAVIFAPIQIVCLGLDIMFQKSGPTMDYIVIATKETPKNDE